MSDIGPVQLLAIGFGPDADYKGQIMDELARLEGKGLVRILDLLFVGVDDDTGDLLAFDYQGDELGGLVGALLGFAFEGQDVLRATVTEPAGGGGIGLSRDNIEQLVRQVPPDEAVALLLIEHVWARDLKGAIAAAGGVPLGEGFLSQAALAEITEELRVTVELLDEIEQEELAAPAAG